MCKCGQITETSLIKNPQEPYCRWVFLLEPDDCTALQSGKHGQEQVWTMSKSLNLAACCPRHWHCFWFAPLSSQPGKSKNWYGIREFEDLCQLAGAAKTLRRCPRKWLCYQISQMYIRLDHSLTLNLMQDNEGVVLSERVNSCKVKNIIADHSRIISKCALQSVLGPV